jgi:hypothetical protein
MHPLLQSILAVIAGIVVGSAVNYGIILVNGVIFPLPAGIDKNDFAALREAFANAPPKVMLLPILAHGIINVIMLAPPLWFNVIDIALYLPAGWLGAKLAARSRAGA